MRIVIRCDSGGEFGLGHVTRCLALARALQRTLLCPYEDIVFVTTTPWTRVLCKPFSCVLTAHSSPFLYQSDDCAVFDTPALDWATDARFLHALRLRDVTVIRIDAPYAPQESYDLLVVPNAHQPAEVNRRLRRQYGEDVFSGWDYVILEEQAGEFVPGPPPPSRPQVVFTSGGSDPRDVLFRLWDVCRESFAGYEKRFLVGAAYQGRLTEGARGQDWEILPFRRGLLYDASLVVTLFGQTCYELLYWRVPFVIVGDTPEHTAAGLSLATRSPTRCFDGVSDDLTAFSGWCLSLLTRSRFTEGFRSWPIHLDPGGAGRVAEAILRCYFGQ